MMRQWSGAIGVLFAATSVAAGLRVLMGLDLPGYVVLPWLVRYNVVAGLFGAVAGIGVWRAAPWAIAATAVLATAHLTVLIALVAMRIAGSAVANDSLGAMALRVAIWTGVALVARRGSRTHAAR
jgi:hypothetical protein